VDIVPKKCPWTDVYQKFIHSFQGSPDAFLGEWAPVWVKSHSKVKKDREWVGFN
jgi:hypothetical protein